jgi:hypothetical protein
VLRERGIGMGFQLAPEQEGIRSRDGGGATRKGFGGDAAGLPALLRIAFDGGDAHAEHAGGLHFGHAAIDGCQNLGS